MFPRLYLLPFLKENNSKRITLLIEEYGYINRILIKVEFKWTNKTISLQNSIPFSEIKQVGFVDYFIENIASEMEMELITLIAQQDIEQED